MNKFLSLLTMVFCLFSFRSVSQEGDTTIVLAMDHVDMTWYGGYNNWAEFPNEDETYRKIWMKYTMGCATGGCSDWDYTSMIRLLIPTGIIDSSIVSIDTLSTDPIEIDTIWDVFEVKEPFELGRAITPYGGNLPNDWERDFIFDVTDFAYLLKDSVEVQAFYQGWSSGFSATVEFMFIEGTPPRNTFAIRNLYGSGTYNSAADFEANVLPEREEEIPSETALATLRTIISGHGFDNNLNCAEFCQRNYYVLVDGEQLYSQLLWRDDCGLNAVYPQAGTWLYDRANWCPGDETTIYNHDLTPHLTPGSMATINLNMQPIIWSGTQAPSYEIAAQLILSHSYNFSNDVELMEILSPSDKYSYNRFNPVCREAKIRIRNSGSEILQSCTIHFGNDPDNLESFSWEGSLQPMEETEVMLEISENTIWANAGYFMVSVSEPNGVEDEQPANNSLKSSYTPPVVYEEEAIIIRFKTNNAPGENYYAVMDVDNNIIMERSGNSLSPNTNYRDTLYLPSGCYKYIVTDSGKDGLNFWANPGAGAGWTAIQVFGGQTIEYFEADFGTSIEHYFVIDNSVSVGELKNKIELDIFPNPAINSLTVKLNNPQQGILTFDLVSMDGKTLISIQKEANGNDLQVEMDVKPLDQGIYLLRVSDGKNQFSRKVVISNR